MSYTIERSDELPAVIINWQAGADFSAEFGAAMQDSVAELEQEPTTVFFVINQTEVDISFDDLLQVAAASGIGMDALFHHPKIRQVIIAADSDLIQLSVAGMNSDVYGNIDLHLSPTLKDALDYVRQNA